MKMLLRVFILAAAALFAATASAQQGTALTDLTGAQTDVPPGWSLTPGMVLSRSYDDNVLLRGPGDPKERDYINIINPRTDVTYSGPQADFAARYDGAFILYNQLTTLNSYDQHASITGKRKLSQHQSFFVNASAAAAPTTELLDISGVPYVRTGVFTDNIRAGLDNMISNRTTISVDARFEQAIFNNTDPSAGLLLGGNSIGAGMSVRRRISERTTLTADLDEQHATLGSEHEQFDIQHAIGGIERQMSEHFRVFAGAGASRLGASAFGPAFVGPSWQLGFVEHYRTTIIDASYTRTFIPSFGFGGTTQNEEVIGRVHLPITRRLYTNDLVSYRREDPLVIDISHLRSVWMETAIGYVASPWLRIEGYFNGTRQTAGRVDDALLTHNQYGIQVITGKPVRVR